MTGAVAKTPKKKRRFGRPHMRHRLPGLDFRTPEGRRYREIADAVFAEYEGEDPIRLRELAGLKLTLEQVQALTIRGDRKALEDLVRLSNLITRRENEIKDRARAAPRRDATPSLADIAARHRIGEASA